MVNTTLRPRDFDGLDRESVENTPAAWSRRAETFATSWGAAGWTRAGQSERFVKVLDALKPQPGERLLDYGCGTGALSDLVGPDVTYLGYDFSPGMVARARREHEGVLFLNRVSIARADVVACVGTFNLPGDKAATWQTLRWLWHDLEPRAMAVSLYAGRDSRCLTYTVDETLRAVAGFSWRVSVERWRHNDILAVVRR